MNHILEHFPILSTERLILRKLETKDVQEILNYQSDKNNFLYADLPIYDSINQVKTYITKMNRGVDEHKWFIWAICLKDSGEIIGSISIWNLDHKENKAELGYSMFPKYRRQGYMKETLTQVLNFGFNPLSLDVIEAYTRTENQPSVDFLKSMQFNFIETIEDDYSNGALMDVFNLTKTMFNTLY